MARASFVMNFVSLIVCGIVPTYTVRGKIHRLIASIGKASGERAVASIAALIGGRSVERALKLWRTIPDAPARSAF